MKKEIFVKLSKKGNSVFCYEIEVRGEDEDTEKIIQLDDFGISDLNKLDEGEINELVKKYLQQHLLWNLDKVNDYHIQIIKN